MPGRRLLAFVLAFVCALAGCATRLESPPATTLGASIARTALDMLGTPYRYGGSDPDGFDCSGLVQYAHASHGISLPRTTALQYRHVRQEPPNLQPGDVLFFRISGRVSHSGIYLGHGRFVHAPSSGKQVSVTRTDNPYFRDRLAGVRRFR
ncbi:MAG: C40 family peptidase [Gammaproteobacteria bacterium]|nr:C40 family peptidase [Gammaproteobacteria bacterium]NNF61172.1 C40 family peptidase [Gammaproteobacteria bacterium]NNM19867.1 C40 family peptidase [Gammaproteobacteria bacterium]